MQQDSRPNIPIANESGVVAAKLLSASVGVNTCLPKAGVGVLRIEGIDQKRISRFDRT